VGVATSLSVREAAFEAVTRALDVVADLDPRRLRGMQQEFRRIVIGSRPTSFSVIGRACYLNSAELTKSAGIMALSLVHEAVHARFTHAGLLSSGRNAGREEVRCNREALAFLERMEGAGWTNIPKLRSVRRPTSFAPVARGTPRPARRRSPSLPSRPRR
jgi:hypothetical protein